MGFMLAAAPMACMQASMPKPAFKKIIMARCLHGILGRQMVLYSTLAGLHKM